MAFSEKEKAIGGVYAKTWNNVWDKFWNGDGNDNFLYSSSFNSMDGNSWDI